MISFRSGRCVAAWLVGAAWLAQPGLAAAQGYFIPPQNAPQKSAPVARPAPRPAAPVQQALPPPPPVEIPSGMPGVAAGGDAGDAGDQAAATPLPAGPVPELPALAKGTTPPPAVIGVLGVPEVMRAATASQEVERVITERRDRLQADAQKEQAVWRDLQQQLSTDRATLSPDQARTRERDLQDRITNAQKSFRDRNRIIQETAQYSLNQIERTLIAVIRQVAESRGMNLVLHRAQVALNVNEFDITEQVTQQMNKVMPSITIAPEGVSPIAQAQPSQAPAPGAAPAPVPASAPPSPPPPARR